MKRILALLLMLSMLFALGACGNAAESAAPAESAAVSEAAPVEEAPVEEEPVEEASVVEEVSAVEEAPEAAPAVTIEYPLAEEYTFTMTAIMRNNVLAVLGDQDFSVTSAYRGLAEATGCAIEFNMLGEATADEKINIALASGDMTDFYTNLGTYAFNRTGAITDGVLFDMAPMLEEFAPDYKARLDADADLAASAYNPDGTLCIFVSQEADIVSKGILIRQDWLDELKMEIPTNREDLEEVLRAFQSEMGAATPIMVNAGLESGLNHSFNAPFAGLRGMDFMLTEPNGKEVTAVFASENFIDYIMYLNHLYNEGLITDDFMSTGREYGNWESTYYSGKCGVWSDGFRELDPANRSNADDPDYKVAPFALTDYECHVSERSTASMNGTLFLTSACEEPELALQFINYCYTEEGGRNGLYGIEGEGYTLTDGKVALTENITNNENGWSINNALLYYGGQQWMPTCADVEFYELIGAKESIDGIKYWTEAYGDKSMKLPSAVALSAEETSEFYSLASDVLTLFSEAAVKVITGDMTEDDYRAAIEDANGMGLTRMTEMYQAAYDAYLAR